MSSVFKRKGRKGYTLKWVEASGRVRMKAFPTRTKAEEERGRVERCDFRNPTLKVYAEEWLKRSKAHLRNGTYQVYTWATSAHILPALGHLELRRLTRALVKNFIAECLQRGLARKSVSNIRGTLHACLEEALDERLIEENPARIRTRGRGLRLAPSRAERAAKVRALTLTQLRAFVAATSGRSGHVLRFMALTGVRPGEALALQWDDLDLDARQAEIRRGVTRGRVQPTKTGHERTIDLAAPLVEELRALDAETKARALAAGAPRSPWCFPSGAGTPIKHGYLERDFKATLKAAKLSPHFTPHSLRHSFASILMSARESIQYVQRQLGHATIQMTVDLYGSWLPAGDLAAVDRLAASLDVTRDCHHESLG